MLEKHIEKQCVDLGTALGIKNVKLSVTSNRGYPDRLFFPYGGVPFFVEFKRPNGVLSEKQKYHIHALAKLNYLVYVCYSVDDFKEILLQYDTERKKVVSLPLPGTGS